MSTAPTPSRRARRSRAGELIRSLKSRSFRRFTGANLVSITGTWMQVVAQNWLVLRLTGSATAVGVTVALQALPSVVFGMWGGVVADRAPKRLVLVVTQLLLATLASVLGIVTIAGNATIGAVYALALLLGIVMAIDAPSSAALGAELVPHDDLANAIALGSIVNGIGRIVGMSLAGALVALVGAGPVFIANAVSYLAVVAVLVTLHPDHLRPVERSARGDGGVRAGVRHVVRSPVMLTCMVLAFIVAAFGRNFQVTMAAMSNTVFRTGARGYGELSVVFAVGALCGGLAAARVHTPRVRIVAVVAITASALQIASSLAPTFVTFAAVVFPIALAAVVFDTAALATVQIAAGDAHRGRAVALFGTVVMLGSTAGAPTLGWLADCFGGRASLALGGAVVFAGTGLTVAVRRARPFAHAGNRRAATPLLADAAA